VIAGGLLETSVALGVSAAVTALMLATSASQVRLAVDATALAVRIVEARQVDHLIDETLGRAAGLVVADADATQIVVTADIDGDGWIDPHSAERTTLILRRGDAGRRLLHRQGRQSMAIADDLPGDAAWELRDRFGEITHDPSAARALLRPRDCGAAECRPAGAAAGADNECRCRRVHAVGTS
jgi:hypothetical protein